MKIDVEGYEVRVEAAEGKYLVFVPRLPGCAVQVDRKEDAKGAIRKAIGLYLLELASKKPTKKGEGEDGPESTGRRKRPAEKVRR